MNDEIQSLLDSLRRGQYEDPAEKIALLAAALHEGKADEVVLESLLRAPQIPLRLAALEACRLRKLPALERMLVALAGDPESRVREKLLECLDAVSTTAAGEILIELSDDAEPRVRAQFIKASEGRKDFALIQVELLLEDTDWSIRLFHPATVRSVEVWLRGTKDEALNTAMGILFAQVRSADHAKTAATKVIRRYDLVIGSQIKDLRTGKITTRLAQLFRGRVDLVPVAPTD